MPVPKSVFYKDFDILFEKHPVTRKISTLHNNEAVKRALKSLVLTNKFERAYSPDFGCDIKKRLFEPMDGTVADDIANDVEFAVGNYEPRVKLIEVNVKELRDTNRIEVTIVFRPINQNAIDSVSVFIERVR